MSAQYRRLDDFRAMKFKEPHFGKLSVGHFFVTFLLLFAQFKVVEVEGFDVPLSLFSLAILALWLLDFKKLGNNTILFFLLLSFTIVIKIAIDMSPSVRLSANYNTALLFFVSVIFLIIFSTVGIRKWSEGKWHSMIRFALYIIATSIILQYFFVNIMGSMDFLTPLGDSIVYGRISEIRLFSLFGYRMPGTYIEPSFAALVIFTLILILSLKKVYLLDLAVSAACLFVVQSALGIIIFLGFVIYIKLLPKKNNWKNMLLLLGVAIISIWILLAYAPGRLNELSIEGTSGYYRFIFPLQVVLETLKGYWLGIPFGSMEEFTLSFGVMNGGNIGSSIDNGLAVLFIYFGWAAVLFLALALMHLIKKARNVSIIKFSVGVFLMLMFTGGVFLFTFCMLLCLLIYSLRINVLSMQYRNRKKYLGRKKVRHYD